ncbi:MAG: PorP/SprF family type IX secretion system membrane protein, partial [Cytophagaceae bacterium]
MRIGNFNKKVFSVVILSLVVSLANAQDIHFSQFYSTALATNPALTGLFKQDYRATLIYRRQWKQINASFITKAFGGDANFILSAKDKLGVGIFVMNDHVGDGIIKNNTFLVSTAYHRTLDAAKRHRVSIGVQTGFVQKNIDYTTLIFGSQIHNYAQDPNSPSGEPLGKTNFSYLNLNSGAVWTFKYSDKLDMQSGISFFNMVKPKESFIQSLAAPDINKLRGRFLLTGNVRYQLTDKISLMPAFMLMKQTKAMDLNIGSSVGYAMNMDKSTIVRAGLWYRSADAVVLSTGIRFKNYDLGLSYDFTSSSLNQVKNAPTVNDHAKVGAFEFVLTYYGFFKRALP